MEGAGKYEEITYEAVIASAKQLLNLENSSDYDAFLEFMMDEALRNINDLTLFEKKICDIEVEDGTAELPCGFVRLFGLYTPMQYSGGIYAPPYICSRYIDSCGCATAIPFHHDRQQISAGHITLGYPFPAFTGTASIAYLSRLLNKDGLPIMYLRHERGVRAYVCYRYLMRMANSQPTPFMVQQFKGDGRIYYNEYNNQKAYLKGKAQEERFAENRTQIGLMFNAWISPMGAMR